MVNETKNKAEKCQPQCSVNGNINERLLKELIEVAQDYAQGHGICMRLKGHNFSGVVEHVPFTLVPSVVERRLFEQAYGVHKDMSLLYHKVAFDFEFLYKSLIRIAESDEFTRNLLNIYVKVKETGLLNKTVALTIQRSDYMFHQPTSTTSNGQLSLKQVEVNNIASSFAGLSSRVTNLHKYLLKRYGRQLNLDHCCIPENNALYTVSRGLVDAWDYYNKNVGQHGCLLFVLEEQNRNVIDQRAIEEEILIQTNHKAEILRLTLLECAEKLQFDASTRRLTCALESCSSPMEIGVIYFRTGYVPQQYAGEAAWKVRLTMEMSKAVKCPWIGAHLAGTKKVQQILAGRNGLNKFFPDDQNSDAAERIRNTFVGLYGLEKDRADTERTIQEACINYENYVLKPQLEGGGNNFYGAQVKARLIQMSPDEREAYILMDRLHPRIVKNRPIRANDAETLAPPEPIFVDMVNEMGTFGYLLSDGPSKILANISDGHLLRTKTVSTDEGGVMAGASALDSPYLLDDLGSKTTLCSNGQVPNKL